MAATPVIPKTFTLLGGTLRTPSVGLGTWRSSPNEVHDAILKAIDVGYRHFDCAAIYENEKEIGRAFQAAINSGKVARSELFITSKLWNTMHRPEDVPKAINQTLCDLRLDYLDLYLMHWPVAFKNRGDGNSSRDENNTIILDSVSIEDTWRAMEKLVDEKKVKAIGVSNFNVALLRRILSIARIHPAANQVELHPHLPQHELVEFCHKCDILPTAYSPLGSSSLSCIKDPTLIALAAKLKVSVAQLLIAWAAQRGTLVIPKSANPARLAENFAALNVAPLNTDDKRIVDDLHKTAGKRYVDPVNFWGIQVSPFDME
ncbi:NADP-dependent oxidoreductase domain-containing protein [Zopfochytrium polystomum]|nr:NADP-dependent oxidoreductase domain-containing protein [Zopfochytrium polystomum]